VTRTRTAKGFGILEGRNKLSLAFEDSLEAQVIIKPGPVNAGATPNKSSPFPADP
jgi:hypothetical protein